MSENVFNPDFDNSADDPLLSIITAQQRQEEIAVAQAVAAESTVGIEAWQIVFLERLAQLALESRVADERTGHHVSREYGDSLQTGNDSRHPDSYTHGQ